MGVFAAAIPTVIREPELAFDVQRRRHLEHYGLISHRHCSWITRNAEGSELVLVGRPPDN
jgi:hypothetical protein